MLYNSQFIDKEEAPQKKLAHFLSSLSPTQYICGAVTSPHTCGCDITGLGLSKTQKRFYHGVMPPKDADGIANHEDPDQTAPLGLILVCTVWPELSVRNLRISMLSTPRLKFD